MNWIDRRKKIKEQADAIRDAIVETSVHLSDETAQALPASVFKRWEADTNYVAGEIVSFEDVTYRVVQTHKSQSNWLPDLTQALYSSFKLVDDGSGNQYQEWKQPSGGHDAYNIGDKVMYNGQVYESLINGNTWSPEAYTAGWKLIN